MELITVSLKTANEFVETLHRHHKKVQGHKFTIGAVKDGKLVGVCIVGRPVSRMLDTGDRLEITRLCTDGTRNACSFLYGHAAKAAKCLGYKVISTYILDSESGVSLKASGYKFSHNTGGGSWSRPSRGREDKAPIVPKQMWERVLHGIK